MSFVLERLTEALTAHRAGDLLRAEALYRGVLTAEPEQTLAVYLLGMLLLGSRRAAEAVAFLRVAARVRAGEAAVQVNFANALAETGDSLGAAAACRVALAMDATLAPAHATLGKALLGLGDAAGAEASYARALRHDPGLVAARIGLGMARMHLGQAEAALTEAEMALAVAPGHVEALFLHGTALAALGRTAAARGALEAAVVADPGHARAWANLANACIDQDDLVAAEGHLRRAVALAPELAEAQASLGFLLAGCGRLAEAVAACDAAIRVRPDFAQAHWNRSFSNLLAGNFSEGWEEYEWRKRHDRFACDLLSLPGVEWQGEDIAGQRLLVQAEQGLGDTIQFARYLPLLVERGADVTIACPRPLMALLRQMPVRLVEKGPVLPDYDVWVDQMSLPRLFGTEVATIPSPDAYLRAEPDRVSRWRAVLPQGARIGVVWAGNPLHSNDRRRSMPIAALAPLVAEFGAALVSLQVGPGSAAITERFGLRDYAPLLTDFAETAAAIACLDHVVAVDTSTAHLAAAMGQQVSILLPFAPDWRWMIGRADSPWYRSVRLYRQPIPGDWDAVVAAVLPALRQGVAAAAA